VRTAPTGTGRYSFKVRNFKPGAAPADNVLLSLVQHKGRLLFTRNVDLVELDDIIAKQALVPGARGVKGFRHGLSCEYGTIAIVMNEEFFPQYYNGFNLVRLFTLTHGTNPTEEDLTLAASACDFNHNINKEDTFAPDPGIAGRTASIRDLATINEFMGYYPQLDLHVEVPLCFVKKILYPEHLWIEMQSRIQGLPPSLQAKFHKVSGTGATEADFLNGRSELARRSRIFSGGFTPVFGKNSLYRFELAYFQTVLEANASIPFVDRAALLYKKYGFTPLPRSVWLDGLPSGEMISRRGQEDWAIFVQPKDEDYFAVLEATLKVLQGKGIQFKIPQDMDVEWRAGRDFHAPESPKIKIYVNRDTLPVVMAELETELAKLNITGTGKGPSFTKRYDPAGLLHYKMEYFTGQDARAVIANRHSTMDEKKAALEAAGFVGENFYRKADEADPLPQTAEAGNPATPSPAEKMQAGLARARKEWEELKPALASLATGIAEKETEAAGVQADIGEIEAALTMLEDKYRQLHIELISAIEDKEMQSIADLSPLSSAYSRLSPTLKSALPQTKAAIEVLRVSFVRNEKETLVRAQEKYDCEVRQLKTVVGELENIKRRIVSELATLQASARSAEGKRGELSTLINETLALAGPIIETGAALQNILGEMGDARVSLPT